MVFRLMVLAAAVGVLSGCVVGQSIPLDHVSQQAQHKPRHINVFVSVEDTRPFVANGDKNPNYIGHYRSGYGIPYDVTTANNNALAEQIRKDLAEELENLGFTLGKNSKALFVDVKQWNFDSYINTTFWYEISVSVLDDNGAVVATDTIKDEIDIDGSFWVGPKYATERELPQHYNKIINKLLRGNPEVLAALNDV